MIRRDGLGQIVVGSALTGRAIVGLQTDLSNHRDTSPVMTDRPRPAHSLLLRRIEAGTYHDRPKRSPEQA